VFRDEGAGHTKKWRFKATTYPPVGLMWLALRHGQL
jgi:hypothetical protein